MLIISNKLAVLHLAKKFYLTTPIYYPSGALHIGHAYTTSAADAIARYKRLRGYDVFFLTGSDEHGQKIEKKASEEGLSPMNFVDKIVPTFILLWERLGITYDKFVRTTDPKHIETVQKVFSRYLAQGDIQLGSWRGYYCISCEENYSEARVIKRNGGMFCVHGHPIEMRDEKSYFFKMSHYAEWLRKYIDDHEEFILPKHRVNEMVRNFLDEDLVDLSVSRTTFSWGAPVLENKEHVIYVWIDALMSYITGLGYLQEDHARFDKYWADETEILQIVGKEITRFHCIYWPIMLKALGLRAPTTVFAHGWITTKEGKMSKSLGNVIDPNDLLERFGRDAVRYYLLRTIPLGKDGIYSDALFIECFNAFLANNYGNLAHRLSGMITKYFGKKIPAFTGAASERQKQILQTLHATIEQYERDFDAFDVSAAITGVDAILSDANKYVEELRPWELARDGKNEELANAVGLLVNSLRVASILLSPILCDAPGKVQEIFGFSDVQMCYASAREIVAFSGQLTPSAPLFVRIEGSLAGHE